MKYIFIPVLLNGEKVGEAQIQNNGLLINIRHRLIREMTYGYEIESLSITYSEDNPHDTILTIHSIKESNGN